MKIVRVMKGEYGQMVSEVLKACCDVLFRSDPGQAPDVSPTRPGTPFAIIRDFGQNECMWNSLGSPFRTLHLTKPVSQGTNQDLRCIRDSIVNKQGKVEPKKLEYKHLEGLPCILILVEKGRMGDTFPQSFNCLDLRIRTSENTSSFVHEIGRLCRYPGTINEKCFSSWSDVEEDMFRGERDPFNGGRKVLAVSHLSESKKFLGYATHKAPWEVVLICTITMSLKRERVVLCCLQETKEKKKISLSKHVITSQGRPK
jgi:hypothetical protein